MRPAPAPAPAPATRLAGALALALCLGFTNASCGDSSPETGGDERRDAGTPGAAPESGGTAPRDRRPVPDASDTVPLPAAPDLTADAARAELAGALDDLAPEEASRAALLYLASLGDGGLADRVRQELLAEDGGEYDDNVAAALGLEILLVLGESDAPARTLALARQLIDAEDEVEGIAQALGRIEGKFAADADALLVELAGDSAYDEVVAAALEALATRRSPAAAKILPQIAADGELFDAVRGTAVTAMLMTGHTDAARAADALVASDVDGSELIAGCGVPGGEAAVPYITRIVQRAFAEGNADLEFAEACYALARIYGGTSGAAHGRELIQGWLELDPDLEGDEATYALWVLGDEARTDAAARLLASEVASAARHDPELAVDLLEHLAERGLARDPRFEKAVSAAAATPPRAGLPGLDLATQRLRAAAAYAFLRAR